MRQLRLELPFVLLAALVLASPALAAPTAPSFDTWLGTLPPPSADLVPEHQEMGPCSTQVTCNDGTVLSCSGSSTCTSSTPKCGSHLPGYVECDGQRTSCSLDSCDIPCSAEVSCPGDSGVDSVECFGIDFTCSGGEGNSCHVTCNGQTTWCPGYEYQTHRACERLW